MNLFAGLEKFGIKTNEIRGIYEEEEKKAKPQKAPTPPKPAVVLREDDFLFAKAVRCPACENRFKTKTLKNGKARRKQPDSDLRPRYEFIDTLKYEIVSCPFCGYSAMSRFFAHLIPAQTKLIRDNVTSKLTLDKNPNPEVDTTPYDYPTAVERYKLALFCTMEKRGHTSEKAYTCLKISWLYRGYLEELLAKDPTVTDEIKKLQDEEKEFYLQAFDGLQKAIASENYPICGMDQYTMDLLIASMALRLGEYKTCSGFLASIISSKTVPSNIKTRAVDMKQELSEAIRNSK